MCARELLLVGIVAIVHIVLINPAQACSGRQILGGGVSAQDKQTILNLHNSMRQSIALGQVNGQPSGSNMQEMKWDEELASKAQQWAQSCLSEQHDNGRHVSRFSVGQNIATTWTTKPPESAYETAADWGDATHKWFTEYRNYRFGKLFYVDDNIGHYTQMAWANTNLVGCGYSFYWDRKGFTKNYICNYGPSGNVISQEPYIAGQPSCQTSGMQPSSTYQGLCDGIQSVYQQNTYQQYQYQYPKTSHQKNNYYNQYRKNYNTYWYNKYNYYK